MDLPPPSIHIEPPTEDAVSAIFDSATNPEDYFSNSHSFNYFSNFKLGSLASNDGTDNFGISVEYDGTVSFPEGHPYPYQHVDHQAPRESSDPYGSPFTNSSFGDQPDGSVSPYSPYFSIDSPNLASDLSHSSPSLSPITRGLSHIYVGSDETLDKPSIFRNRSHSTVEGTVAPSETWCESDPRPRSSSYSQASTLAATWDPNTLLGDQAQTSQHAEELDDIGLEDGFLTQNGSAFREQLMSFSNDGVFSSYNISPSPSLEQLNEDTSSTLFAPPDVIQSSNSTDIYQPQPRHASHKPPVLSLQTDVNSRFIGRQQSHSRHRSESSGLLSAGSPISRHGDKGHRSTLSSPDLRRHSPYPSPHSSPASASDDSQVFHLSPHNPPTPIIALSPSRVSLHRRNTSAAPSSILRLGPAQLHRVSSNPSSSRHGRQKYDRFKMENSDNLASSSGVRLDDPRLQGGMSTNNFRSPGTELLHPDAGSGQTTTSDEFKPIVGSDKIVAASTKRRKREARFCCSICQRTFTANHNLINHMRSHGGIRPYPCSKCQSEFTTQGVLQRHIQKCAPELAGVDRRRRLQQSK